MLKGNYCETLDIQHIERNTTKLRETPPASNQLPRHHRFVSKNVTPPNFEAISSNSYYHFRRPNAELNVEIMANGVAGYGEPRQMNDTLGVEIHEWLSESGNGKWHSLIAFTGIFQLAAIIIASGTCFVKFSIVFVMVRNAPIAADTKYDA